MVDSLSQLTFSLSDIESAMEERECIECVEAVEMEFLSFLNGLAMAFAPFCMDFLRDVALPEMIDNLVELVSVEFTIMQNWFLMSTYRGG
jgi:hypothetical protein